MTKLYVLCGIPFSGKTTLAKSMAKNLNLEWIDLDEIKFAIFGRNITDEDLEKTDWDKVYQEIYKRIETLLRSGKNVAYDTGNFTKNERGLVRNIAEKLGNIETITIFVDTPYEVAKQRLFENRNNNQRFNVSDKDFEDAVAGMEKPGEDENTLVYDSKIPEEEWIKENLQ